MSQNVETGAQEDDAAPQTPPRAPSATRRVRARLARRITAQRSAPVKQVLEPLAAVHRELHPKADLALLQHAYDIAEEAHRGQRRKSGDPYITHPLAVATILAELGMDTIRIAAGFGSPPDQFASSRRHAWSSARGGAPWLTYSTGMDMGYSIS